MMVTLPVSASIRSAVTSPGPGRRGAWCLGSSPSRLTTRFLMFRMMSVTSSSTPFDGRELVLDAPLILTEIDRSALQRAEKHAAQAVAHGRPEAALEWLDAKAAAYVGSHVLDLGSEHYMRLGSSKAAPSDLACAILTSRGWLIGVCVGRCLCGGLVSTEKPDRRCSGPCHSLTAAECRCLLNTRGGRQAPGPLGRVDLNARVVTRRGASSCGRQPLCGTGVRSSIAVTRMPGGLHDAVGPRTRGRRRCP